MPLLEAAARFGEPLLGKLGRLRGGGRASTVGQSPTPADPTDQGQSLRARMIRSTMREPPLAPLVEEFCQL